MSPERRLRRTSRRMHVLRKHVLSGRSLMGQRSARLQLHSCIFLLPVHCGVPV